MLPGPLHGSSNPFATQVQAHGDILVAGSWRYLEKLVSGLVLSCPSAIAASRKLAASGVLTANSEHTEFRIYWNHELQQQL